MNKLIAGLVAVLFSFGVFAQTAAPVTPAAPTAAPMVKAEKKPMVKKVAKKKAKKPVKAA